MTGDVFYVQVRGAWEGAPPIYIGPFDSYDGARDAIRRSGASPTSAARDPKHEILIHILNEDEARQSGRRDRHTLPPKTNEPGNKGFDVPATLDDYNGLYYRQFGYH